ncbi:MAG: esterase [Myxococcales bacterium]|nr:esterase [Myxococcales bacterium]
MALEPLQRRLGGLDCLVVPGSPEGLIVVMCHGFGADHRDLLPLAQAVRAPTGTTWLFPNAPIQVPIGPGAMGRAWFPIDLIDLQAAMLAGTHRDLSLKRPGALESARTMLAAAIDEFRAPLRRVIFGGFSQGAMLATSVTLHAAESPAGLAILSGTLLDRETWARLAPDRAGLPFFQSHGEQDPLLSVEAARRLHALLSGAGLVGTLHTFRGAHEIPAAIVARWGDWLHGLHDARPGLLH